MKPETRENHSKRMDSRIHSLKGKLVVAKNMIQDESAALRTNKEINSYMSIRFGARWSCSMVSRHINDAVYCINKAIQDLIELTTKDQKGGHNGKEVDYPRQ